MNMAQLLKKENVVSIRDVQKNPSQALTGVTRIMRGSKTLGVFFDPQAFEDMVEDMEAARSEEFVKSVAQARKDLKAGKRFTSLEDVLSEYGI